MMKDQKKFHFKIKIKNADPWAAGWITQYLYKMVDKKEIKKMERTFTRTNYQNIKNS